MSLSSGTPGVYGKLASQGDFVTRRLGPEFIQPWDTWLQLGMLESRARMGAGWLERYLNAPLWRFVLAPDVCGAAAVAGVLLPSVDRVGRHFPLTLAAALDTPAGAPLLALAETGAAWFDALADLSLRAMCGAMSVAALDSALAALGAPVQGDCVDPPPSLALATALCPDGLVDCSLFWTGDAAGDEPGLMLKFGLPPAAAFATLLAGPSSGRPLQGAR